MYLVDKRISSDPSNLHSVHPTTYLFKYARPTQTDKGGMAEKHPKIAYLLTGLGRGGKSRPREGGLRGRDVPKVERNEGIRRPPVSRSVNFLN